MKHEFFKSHYGYYNFRTTDGKPTEEMTNELKNNGWRWSRFNNCWYPASTAAKDMESHEKFVSEFTNKYLSEEKKPEQQAKHEPSAFTGSPADITTLEQVVKLAFDDVVTDEEAKKAAQRIHDNIRDSIVDERIAHFETLVAELREKLREDQKKIERLESELSWLTDTDKDLSATQEQEQLDAEAEYQRENTLTDEEEDEIISRKAETGSESDSSSDDGNKDGAETVSADISEGITISGEAVMEAMDMIARAEEPEAEKTFDKNKDKGEITVSAEELKAAKSVLPTAQYVTTLQLSQGEEGDFFKRKIKEIASAVNNAPNLGEDDGSKPSPIVIRYFHPSGTETLVTEIGVDGEAYGFQCINGDYEMAEWGYLDLNEIKGIRGMEIDYHVPEGMTVERWLYQEHPDEFPQYAEYAGGTQSGKSYEEENAIYIHSEEFISKFGDWEKANRLEKLRNAESIEKDGKIILNGSDITSVVESLIENEDRKGLQSIEKEIGKTVVGNYINPDTKLSINVSNRNVTEISNHHYLFKEHIQSVAYIPEIIEKAVFIGEVENEDKQKHPNIEKYLYFATGLKLDDTDYTCKSVIGMDSNKNCYYDQSLSTIEKGRLVDYVLQNKKAGNLSPLMTQRETDLEGNELPYVYYDKRLLSICQVPQLQYMENINGIWQPTEETVELVKKNVLFIEKKGDEYFMVENREAEKNPSQYVEEDQNPVHTVRVSTSKKANWKNKDGEEMAVFIEQNVGADGRSAVSIGLNKNFNVHNIYNDVDNSYQVVAVSGELLRLFFALSEPNNPAYTEQLSPREKEIFENVMKSMNPEWENSLSVTQEKNKSGTDNLDYIGSLSSEQANSRANELGYYFEYNDDEKTCDIHRETDGDWVGSYSEGGFGYAGDIMDDGINNIPDSIFREVTLLAEQFFDKYREEQSINRSEAEQVKASEQVAESPFDRVTKRYQEKYKDFFDSYEKMKEAFIENESRYVGNARIRISFEHTHDELVKLQIEELRDIIKESGTHDEARDNALRYFNAFGNDGLTTNNLYLSTGTGEYKVQSDGYNSSSYFSTNDEKIKEYIENVFNETHARAEPKKNPSQWSYFVRDTAEFEQSWDFSPITNLSAKEAVTKYAELQDKGFDCGIGIYIPGDFVFDDPSGQGSHIFTRYHRNDDFIETFRIYGDSFIDNLKERGQRAEKYIKAYEELYRAALDGNLNVELPTFLFKKTQQLYHKPSLSYDFDVRGILDDLLESEFATLDKNVDVWNDLIRQGADARKALKTAAEDANLGDNLNWLLDNLPESTVREYFADKEYADEVFNIAKDSVTHDRDMWSSAKDIGIDSFMRIAELCGRKGEAEDFHRLLLREEGWDEPETQSVENDVNYAYELADWIIQRGLSESDSQENYIITFDEILENTDTPEDWLRRNYSLVNVALKSHDDNELLEYNPEENIEADTFNLYFCTNSDEMGENTLFKFDEKKARWVRKTEDELSEERQTEPEPEPALPYDVVIDPLYTINNKGYTASRIEAMLTEDIQAVFRELSPEPYVSGVKLYGNPDKDGRIKLLVQYGTNELEGKWSEDALFNAISDEHITFEGIEVDVNPITPEKSGTIREYMERLERQGASSEKEEKEEVKPLPVRTIFTAEPFGADANIFMVETDLRRGIPMYDIVGISDGQVKAARETIRAAMSNSGLRYHTERILQSISPADVRKEGNFETLAMAADLLNQSGNGAYKGDDVLILGELELSGRVRPVRAITAIVSKAVEKGIHDIIVPAENVAEAQAVPGARVKGVSSLNELNEVLSHNEPFPEHKTEKAVKDGEIIFNDEYLKEITQSSSSFSLDGYYDAARAIEIAVAGKHNILLSGAPGSGKTMLADALIPALSPALTESESAESTKVYSVAGLLKPDEPSVKFPPMRMPHHTASLEGMVGGGETMRPGEMSLAHNGTLFLDDAPEFRSSVLQMLRAPIDNGSIILSRAGRTTIFPSRLQLAMTANPCPCGNYGTEGKVCLCSQHSIDMYNAKYMKPLGDRLEIKQLVSKDEKDNRRTTIDEMRKHIENAYKIQREKGTYNGRADADEIRRNLSYQAAEYLGNLDAVASASDKDGFDPVQKDNMLKVALTIANMDGRREIALDDLREARELTSPLYEKPNNFRREPESLHKDENAAASHTPDTAPAKQEQPSPAPTKKDIKKIREQCREILDKYDNTHLTQEEKDYVAGMEPDLDDRHQVEASFRRMKYIYTTTKDSEGYWQVDNGREITGAEARRMLDLTDFMSAVDRASFHITSGRNTKDGGYIWFNDGEPQRSKVVEPYELTKEDISVLSQYEGGGGLNEKNRSADAVLNEFYTPDYLISKVWEIVDAYAPDARSVLEPSAGTGKFANGRADNEFTMHELDETSARINRILHPDAIIIQGAYQEQFFDENGIARLQNYVQPKYDIVIGNPPYGAYKDEWHGKGEGREFDRYEEYFISKGLDALKDRKSFLAFVVPSGFLNSASDKAKEIIASKGVLYDAYRLPEGTFPTTEVGTDIIIMAHRDFSADIAAGISKDELAKAAAAEISNGDWFRKHPERILGEVKTRRNRFGRDEEYVAVHEGMTVQNELDKIDCLLSGSPVAPVFKKPVGKVDRRDGISEIENTVVGVGVAPTISALQQEQKSTAGEKQLHTFVYSGMTFVPFRNFREQTALEAHSGISDTDTLVQSLSERDKLPAGNGYSVDKFLGADKEGVDESIFYCADTKGFYIPVDAGLFKIDEERLNNVYRKELSDFRAAAERYVSGIVSPESISPAAADMTLQNQIPVPEEKIRAIYAETYPDNEGRAKENAEKFIEAWRTKSFEGLMTGLGYSYAETPKLRELFFSTLDVPQPDGAENVLLWLANNYAAEESVPEWCRFHSWNDALIFAVKRRAKPEIQDYFREHTSVAERTAFLKDTYNLSGGGWFGFNDDWFSGKGCKINAIIDGRFQDKSFTWSEISAAVNYLILEGDYFSGKNKEQYYRKQLVSDFIGLVKHLAYDDSDEQLDFLSERRDPDGPTVADVLGTYLPKYINGERFFRLPGDDGHEESLALSVLFGHFEDIKNILLTDDRYGSVAGFLDDREKPLENFENEDDYYAQPIAADILKDILDGFEKEAHVMSNLEWLVNVHNCDIESTKRVLEKLYDKFPVTEKPYWEASERSKVIDIAFGHSNYEQNTLTIRAERQDDGNLDFGGVSGTDLPGVQWKVTEEDLDKVFGIYDDKFDYHTVWDRKFAAMSGMPKEDVARLIQWDYSNRKEHMFVTFATDEKSTGLDVKTSYVLDKLAKAGIEVVTDKGEFDRILAGEKLLQKMSEDLSEFDALAARLEEEESVTQDIQGRKELLDVQVDLLRRKNYEEFVNFVKSTEKFIPAAEFNSGSYHSLNIVKSRILLVPSEKNNGGSDLYVAFRKKLDGNIPVIVYQYTDKNNSNYFGLNYTELDNFRELTSPWSQWHQICLNFDDGSLLKTYKENLKKNLEQRLILEEQKQNSLIAGIGEIQEKLNTASGISTAKEDMADISTDRKTVADAVKPDTLSSDYVLLDKSLRFNSNFEIQSSKLGGEVSVFPGSTGKNGLGIRHIIEERFSKDNLSQDEISALCGLILEAVREGDITRDSENRCELTKSGIVAIVRKDFDNDRKNWILTGFHYTGGDEQKKREATEAIKTVIANHSGSDGYSYFRSQVGAVIASLSLNIPQTHNKSSVQPMVLADGVTYGFAHEGKIYLNPDIMSSEAAVHEYTHLWDSYTQKTNPELWKKGMEIFRGTSLWNDVLNDQNYADIKNDENLVLSECHARICGKIADAVLQKVLERDGDLKKADMIDWDKEVDQFIYENFESSRVLSDGREIKSTGYGSFGVIVDVNAIRSWFSSPMKDLFVNEKNININQEQDTTVPLDSSFTLNGITYHGRIVHNERSEFEKDILIFTDSLNSTLEPILNSSLDHESELYKDAKAIDEQVYCYVPKEILQHDDDYVLNWCANNGIEIDGWEKDENVRKLAHDTSSEPAPEILWDDLRHVMAGARTFRGDFDDIVKEVQEENPGFSDTQLKDEVVYRLLDESIYDHGLQKLYDKLQDGDAYSISVLNDSDVARSIIEIRTEFLEKISAAVIDRKLKNIDEMQEEFDRIFTDDVFCQKLVSLGVVDSHPSAGQDHVGNKILLRDDVLDQSMISRLHTAWTIQINAGEGQNRSVKEISDDFIRLGIKPGDTVGQAIEKIRRDRNKGMEDAELFFNKIGEDAGYSTETRREFGDRINVETLREFNRRMGIEFVFRPGFRNDSFEKNYVTGHDAEFRYRMLSRMKSDCDYYLEHEKSTRNALFGGNPDEHIDNMISLYRSFGVAEVPDWLTVAELREYALKMTGRELFDIINENISLAELQSAGAEVNKAAAPNDAARDNSETTVATPEIPYVIKAYDNVVSAADGNDFLSKMKTVLEMPALKLTAVNNWRNFYKYGSDLNIVLNIDTRESVLYHSHWNDNKFILAHADSDGIITPLFDEGSDAFRELSPSQKDKLRNALDSYKRDIDRLLGMYAGFDKDSGTVYLRDFKNNVKWGFGNFKFYNPADGSVFEADNENVRVAAFGISFPSAGDTSFEQPVYQYDHRNLRHNYECGFFYASFDAIYAGGGLADISRIKKEDEAVRAETATEIYEIPLDEDGLSWSDKNKRYEKQVGIMRKAMLDLSNLTEEEWTEKAGELQSGILTERSERRQLVSSGDQRTQDANLILSAILKEPFSSAKTFEAGAAEVSYVKNGGGTDVIIDGRKSFTVNENMKSLLTYNNYFVTDSFVRALYERFGNQLSVADEEYKEPERIRLDSIIASKGLDSNPEVCRAIASFAYSSGYEGGGEVRRNIGGFNISRSSAGINTMLYIGQKNDILLKYNRKDNVLHLYQAAYDNGLISGIQKEFEDYAEGLSSFLKLSVIKSVEIDGTMYFDDNGRTVVNPSVRRNYDKPSEKKLMSSDEFAATYGANWNPDERVFWEATDYAGYIDLNKLSADDQKRLKESPNYYEETNSRFIHKVLFLSGNIYEKLDVVEDNFAAGKLSEDAYRRNKLALEHSIPVPFRLDEISVPVRSGFVEDLSIDGIPLQEMFLQWATGCSLDDSSNTRDSIEDFTQAAISREDIPFGILWSDVVDYIDGKPVRVPKDIEDEEKKAEIRNEKTNARKVTAQTLFERFLRQGLTKEQQDIYVEKYNRLFNNNVEADYSKLPLFVDGMNMYRDGKKFTLYEQQIKGVAALSNKGNGLLAYDVGVGKTAAGIVSTVNQIQTARSTRPLIMVPKSVIKSWEHDIRELFPDYTLNVLGAMGAKDIAGYYDGNHGLNIPPDSITLCTPEALNNITFKRETVSSVLLGDFIDLMGINDKIYSDNARERAEAKKKVQDTIGNASTVKNGNYIFFENTGFDHITVDEAHRFKNLFKVPRPKKGESNEFSAMGTGEPSKRAIKMFAITQYIQKNNHDRNVFMLTATPFTNSPLEIYSMLSYIARKEMEDKGIKDLYSFCEHYASTRLEQVVSHKNTIEYTSVMKEFSDVQGLQNILKKYIDKVDAEEALVIRPDKMTHPVYLQPTKLQMEIFDFARRVMEYIPDKDEKRAPVLEGINIINKAAISPATLSYNQLIDPFTKAPAGIVIPGRDELVTSSPKLKTTCDTVVACWKEKPDCGQIIYMNIGKEFYPDIQKYMENQGVPKSVFAIIDGTDVVIGGKKVSGGADEARDYAVSCFNDIKNPCKIIIGSSAISEGMNLNGNSISLYNLTLGWNPSESVQVTGRIHRQGNMQGNVHIVFPLLEDSCDPFLYQKHDEKSSRINDLFSYRDGGKMNVDEINPEDAKFALIKDPRTLAKFEISKEVSDLNKEKSVYESQLADYDTLVTNRIKYETKLKERTENKETYIRNYQESLFKGNARTEEEQAAGIARHDKAINDCKTVLKNIGSKLRAMGINNDEDASKFSLDAGRKISEIDSEISVLTSDKHVKEVIDAWNIRLMEERVIKSNRAHTGHLSESILKNLYPFEVTEERVQTERWNAAQKYRETDPERFAKAKDAWEKYQEKKSGKSGFGGGTGAGRENPAMSGSGNERPAQEAVPTRKATEKEEEEEKKRKPAVPSQSQSGSGQLSFF